MGISNQIPNSRISQAGVVPNEAARPASPYEGQMVYQQDIDKMLFWNGTAWRFMGDGSNQPVSNLNQVGLWKMVPTSVSGTGGTLNSDGSVTINGGTTSYVIINNCFTDDFTNYRLLITQVSQSVAGNLNFRLSASGTPNSTATSYQRAGYVISAGTLLYSASNADTCYFGYTSTTLYGFTSAEIYGPKLAQRTNGYYDNAINTGTSQLHSAFTHTQTVSYDGIALGCDTGTFDCAIRIYGYN